MGAEMAVSKGTPSAFLCRRFLKADAALREPLLVEDVRKDIATIAIKQAGTSEIASLSRGVNIKLTHYPLCRAPTGLLSSDLRSASRSCSLRNSTL
jgi:hypothetical protein